jgi:hypothetical protein
MATLAGGAFVGRQREMGKLKAILEDASYPVRDSCSCWWASPVSAKPVLLRNWWPMPRPKDIARLIDREPKTVESHLASIYQKLHVHSRVGAVVEAMRLGELPSANSRLNG